MTIASGTVAFTVKHLRKGKHRYTVTYLTRTRVKDRTVTVRVR